MPCENSPLLPIPGATPNSHCGKTKKLHGNSPNDYVYRGCVPENYCRLVKSDVSECYVCEHDGCNSSTTLKPAAILSFLTILLFKYIL